MATLLALVAQTNDKYHYNAKPLVFYEGRFDYWNDKINIFFLGQDFDLWDLVVDGYEHPIYASGTKVERRVMTYQQKKDYKNHHKVRTVFLNAISYIEYEKITNINTAKPIFDSPRVTHEGNAQVKETKALVLIQKYEAFKTEDEETIENVFSRFQTLVAGLKVLDKGYSTTNHVKKIIRSLPKR